MKRALLVVGFLLSALGRPALAVSDQAPCRAPAPPVSREPNIFTVAQESDLGDAVAERYESFLRVIEDDALTSRLRQVGERLISHMPPTDLHFTFMLMDIPDANAFVLPGGRIYVSRKLIGFTRTEDELAGVLGHEMGHLIARQQTVEMTRRLREVIGVTAVGDREDIFEKYNRLTDNAGRKPGAFRSGSREDGDQIEADRLGLFAVAAAGYDPQAHVRLFDRFTLSDGNKASFLSRMLGTAGPDAKRLAEMSKNAAAIPAGCAETRDPAEAQAYQTWQASVLSFTGLGRHESVPGLVSRDVLTPALRGEVTSLRFSPDGRYVLAQDDAGIAVLTREPLAVLFRVEAPDAEPAQFTPDSRDLIFHTDGLRVERWRVAEQKLVEVHDVVWRKSCHQTALAPDARTLACLDTSFDLWLIDVATAEPVFQKKGFYAPNATARLFASFGILALPQGDELVTMRFSPDARYFASGYRDLDQGTALVIDLQTRAAVPLKNPARKVVTSSFAFLGPDRLVGVNPEDPAKSAIIRLPAGDVIEQLALPTGELAAPAKGNFVMVRPFQKYAVGILDLDAKKVTKGSSMAAFDLFDQVFVAEQGPGDLGLYAVAGDRLQSNVSLPTGELARIQATAVSADFQWLAVSERSRGAVWDLPNHQRVALIRGFKGAYFDGSGLFFADWPKAGPDPRAVLRLNPSLRQVSSAGEIKDRYATQLGQWLLVTKPVPENVMYSEGAAFEMRDVRQPAALWTRAYPKSPPEVWAHAGSDAVVFSWEAASAAGREIIRKDPDLRNSVKLGDIEGDYILEVVAASTGTMRRRMLLETGKGSFRIEEIFVAGDWMMLTDSIGRVLVYSLVSGELQGHAVGWEPAASPAAGLLAVDAGGGRLALYDLTTMRRRAEFTFTHPIALKAFSPDGKRLFVLTTDQVAFVVEVR